MAIEMGIHSCDATTGEWRDEELVTWVWRNDVSFDGYRTIRAPRGSEPMIQDTLIWMRIDAGLTDEEAEALGAEDWLDVLH